METVKNERNIQSCQ